RIRILFSRLSAKSWDWWARRSSYSCLQFSCGGMRAALRAPDRFGMLLGIGIVIGIVAQALLNMSVVLALVPTKGIPLPFISYGGSSIVPTLAGVGILLNISQYAALGKRAHADEGEYEDD